MRFGEDNVFPVDDHEGASRLRHYFYDCSRIYALLTYVRKFMQRAAASTPPTTYRLQSRGADTPPSKRQKTFHTPTSAATPSPDQQLIETALGKEGEKRENAIETLAAEAGETKWVLSTVNFDLGEDKEELRTEVAGYSDIDQDAWRPPMVGRRSFGKFNRELEKHQSCTADIFSTSSARMSNISDEDGEDGENSYEAASKKKVLERKNAQHLEIKQQRKAEKSELVRLAGKRRKKEEVKLNMLTSISGGGGGGSGPSSGRDDKTCYECGEKGHERRACSQKGIEKNQDSPSGQRKRSRPSSEY